MKTSIKSPLLLYSYLATEMLAPFFASFLIMNCVFFLVKLIPFLNFVLELNIGLPDFIRLFSYLFPNIFLYSIPMSAMMGVTIGFARLSSDSEILALKASGISMYKMLPPVLVVATLIALMTSYFSIRLIPLSEVAMRQLTYQLLKEKINKGIKEHVFTEALGDVVVYVDKIDQVTGKWTDVWVSDMRGVDNPVITMASSGWMKSSIQDMTVSIVLRNGSLHKPSNENAQIVQFDQYQINIPLRPPKTNTTGLKRSGDMTMRELLEEGRTYQNLEEYSRKFIIEFHRRLVLPIGCLMISLIGLPLGLQAKPGKKAIGIQAGLAIFVLYYILFTLGRTLAEEGVVPIALAMWTPNILFFLLAIFWIIRVSDEQPLVPFFITVFFHKTWKVITIPISKTYSKIRKGKDSNSQETPETDETDNYSVDKNRITGNPNSRVFHLPACEYYDCQNCTLEFKNIQVALDAGFEPCNFCKDFIDE